MNIGTFRAIRYYLQLSQVEFAKALGVAHSTVSMAEAGHRVITDSMAFRVAHLDVNMDEVYEYMDRKDKLVSR